MISNVFLNLTPLIVSPEFLISDLKSDDSFYKAAFVAASATLATKTTALVAQTASAASSSGTAGFSVGFELKGTALKENSTSSSSTSVGSNITANNFKIKASNKAKIQGSNITATSGEIDAKTIEVLASKDESSNSSSSKKVEVKASFTTNGYTGTSGSVSGSTNNSSSTTYNNSNLNFKNLSLKSKEDTLIKGATITASENLNLDVGKNLVVESVQNTNRNSSRSADVSSSGSANASMSKAKEKTTVLTSLSGANVNIKVQDNTNLKGALISSTKKDGVNLDTGTLTTSNLSNTKNSRNVSLGGSGGSTVSANVALGRENSKSKTLSTITSGNIKVRDTKNSTDIAKLNRDKKDTNLDLYSVKSDVSVSAQVDTNMLTKDGRKRIKKDILDTKNHGQEIYQAAKDVAINDDVSVLEFGSQVNKYASDRKVLVELAAKEDAQKKLKGEEGAQGSQEEIQALSDQLSKKDGLDENTKVSLYDGTQTPDDTKVNSQNDFNKELSNAGYEEKSNSVIINVDKTNMTDSKDVIKSTLHEQERHTQAQNSSDYSDNTGTNLSKARGQRGSNVWSDYSGLNGFSTTSNTSQSTWNNNNHNSATIKAGNKQANKMKSADVKPRQVVSIRGGNPSKAINFLNSKVADAEKPFQGQNLEEFQNYYKGKLNNDIQNIKNQLINTNYSKKQKEEILKKEINKLVNFYNTHEFDTSLITLPNEIKKLDTETKVKIFDSGQKDIIVNSIIKDYQDGEQIIIQGHSAGGGDTQDVAQDLKDKGIKNNVITVQIDSIEPLGDDASIPDNVTKAINVYQSESKTGNKIIDTIDSNAMNGEDEIEREIFNDKTVIINKEFKNIVGPAKGNLANPHQNIDNDKNVQDFIQKKVLLEVKKDIEKLKNESN